MQRINKCLNNKMIEIYEQTIRLQQLQTLIEHYLEEPLRDHCRVASFNKGCLVLVTTDSVWATPLRYQLPELRDKLRREGKLYYLINIKIIVQFAIEEQLIKKNSPKLSNKAREAVLSLARQCGYYPLQKALQSLAHEGEFKSIIKP